MTTYIPAATASELASPAPEGQRHQQAIKIAVSLIGNGMPTNEVFRQLRNTYPEDVTDDELGSIIGWAERQNFQPSTPTATKQIDVQSYRFQSATTQPIVPPEPCRMIETFIASHPELHSDSPIKANDDEHWQDDAVLVIEHLFKSGELINPVVKYREEISKSGKRKYIPADNGLKADRDTALVKIRTEGVPAGDAGAWLRMNPLGEQGTTANSNVTVFRWALLEFDTVPTESQLAFFRRLPLPIGAILTSGGKSLHAWVAINAANADEYKKVVTELFKLLEPFGLDQANKNPSRLSRLCGAHRKLGGSGDGRQRLLYLNPNVIDVKLDLSPLRFLLASGVTAVEPAVGSPADIQFQTQLVLPKIRSLGDFGIDTETNGGNLLGNRYLCRGGGLLVSAPTGIGKSSWVVQASVSWALGEAHLGIKPAFPLKTLIVQAENDDGDVAELRNGVFTGLGLSDEQKQRVRQNVHVVCESSATGVTFTRMVEGLVKLHRPDLLVIDPLFAYLGNDACNQSAVSAFLRNGLNPILQNNGCGLVLIHHTNKPQKGSEKADWKAGDFAYLGSGSSELANWARAVIGIRSIGEHDVFEMVLAKRGKRAGLVDAWQNNSYSAYIHHSKTGICWELGEAPAGKRVFSKADVLSLIPLANTITQTKLFNGTAELGISEKRVRNWLKELLDDEEVFTILTKRPGTNPAKSYSRQRPSGDTFAETLAGENAVPKSSAGIIDEGIERETFAPSLSIGGESVSPALPEQKRDLGSRLWQD